jgi:hypothetical protein
MIAEISRCRYTSDVGLIGFSKVEDTPVQRLINSKTHVRIFCVVFRMNILEYQATVIYHKNFVNVFTSFFLGDLLFQNSIICPSLTSYHGLTIHIPHRASNSTPPPTYNPNNIHER